jgi:hypothetical protein
MRYHTTFWGLLVFALCGCSQPTHPPAKISTADRVVVTNRYSAFGLTVTGEDASRLATAVAAAKQDRLPAAAVFDWDLEFYAGTNFLTLIHLQDRAFMLSNTQFSDDTGVLKTFWQKLESERPR